jgi:2-polyprenyl-3-methyl-5-hydroxy-6-metoxy-1,4-benzoquinol methylase
MENPSIRTRSALAIEEEHAWPGLHDALARRLVRWPGISSETPILDLGCGTGTWLRRFAALGFRDLTGADSGRETVFANTDSIKFMNANLEDEHLPLDEREFGLVTAIEVIEHLARPDRLFDHALKYLSRDGAMLVTTPNVYSLRTRMRFLIDGELLCFDKYANDHHVHPVLLGPLTRTILAPRGLVIRELWTYPENRPIAEGRRWFATLAERVLSVVLRAGLPGDALCLLIARK